MSDRVVSRVDSRGENRSRERNEWPTVTRKACLVNGGIVFEDHSTVVSDLKHAKAEESFRAHLTCFVSKL